MRILLYNEYWNTKGGGEKYLLDVAQALVTQGHRVVVVADYNFDGPAIEKHFNLNIPPMRGASGIMYLEASDLEEIKRYSEDFDLTIITTNFRRFEYRSPQAIFILQAPHGKTWGWNHRRWMETIERNNLFKELRDEHVVVYSHFVADTMSKLYDVNCEVIEPCIEPFEPKQKGRIILSVGRIFNGRDNHKRYEVLIEAFKEFYETHGLWSYNIVGGCKDYQYLSKLKYKAEGYPINFHTNVSHAKLAEHYGEASLFWHGAGHGVDAEIYPENCEHFGISTVEAMSAGCIPIVFGCGGSKEIVQVCGGSTWTTPQELVAFSHDYAYGFPGPFKTGRSVYEEMIRLMRQKVTRYFKPVFQTNWKNYLERL